MDDFRQLINLLKFRLFLPKYNSQFGNVVFNKLVLFSLDIHKAFFKACITGNLFIIEVICNNYLDYIRINYNDDDLFHRVCEFGQLEVAKYLLSLGQLIGRPINITDEYIFGFVMACDRGHLNVVKFLIDICPNLNIHLYEDSPFRHACASGHLDIAQYLWNYNESTKLSLYKKINIHSYDEHGFIYACADGKLELVKWLWELDENIDIHCRREAAFKYACSSGNLEVVKYLWQISKTKRNGNIKRININIDNDNAFHRACYREHYHIAKWLYSIGGTTFWTKCEYFSMIRKFSSCLC